MPYLIIVNRKILSLVLSTMQHTIYVSQDLCKNCVLPRHMCQTSQNV